MTFNIDNITRRSDLQNNDSISCYLTHCAQQSDRAYEVFHTFITDIKPARILEIGTAFGGFTAFMKIVCNDAGLKTELRSYDIVEPSWTYQGLRDMGVDVRVKNIFYENWIDINPDVIEYIQQAGTTIVLCDGGNKVQEFKLLSQYIKPGDFILAHDYAETREIFEQHIDRKIWNWCEISRNDIDESMIKNNLTKYCPELFENAAWVCTQKHI